MAEAQNYLMVNQSTNVVDNVVVWDGGPDWTPPPGYLMLVQATTPALIWQLNTATPPEYVLTQVMGAGAIGFTWDATTQVLTTNQPKPV